jgi:hypothetical protein
LCALGAIPALFQQALISKRRIDNHETRNLLVLRQTMARRPPRLAWLDHLVLPAGGYYHDGGESFSIQGVSHRAVVLISADRKNNTRYLVSEDFLTINSAT